MGERLLGAWVHADAESGLIIRSKFFRYAHAHWENETNNAGQDYILYCALVLHLYSALWLYITLFAFVRYVYVQVNIIFKRNLDDDRK